jgi:hypothetical protein
VPTFVASRTIYITFQPTHSATHYGLNQCRFVGPGLLPLVFFRSCLELRFLRSVVCYLDAHLQLLSSSRFCLPARSYPKLTHCFLTAILARPSLPLSSTSHCRRLRSAHKPLFNHPPPTTGISECRFFAFRCRNFLALIYWPTTFDSCCHL